MARIEGSDATAPSMLLLGHTDVVPVEEDGWSRDPFGGELVEGEVWGRGAVEMLNRTAAMALAVRHLADRASGHGGRSTVRPNPTRSGAAMALRHQLSRDGDEGQNVTLVAGRGHEHP